MEIKRETNQIYPIDERCKDCSLFQTVQDLQKQIEELREKISKLENHKKKDMSNSSIPSSQNRFEKKYPPREKSSLKTGGQIGHIGHNKAYSNNVDEIVSLDSDICPSCGCSHFTEIKEKVKRKQKIDIILKPHITEYQQKHLICNHCGKKFPLKPFPQKGNVEFSDTFYALIGYLNAQANLSYSKISKLFKELININISEGTIDNMLSLISQKQEYKTLEILNNLKNSNVIGSDETSLRINGANSYLWVLQNNDYSYYMQGSRKFETLANVIQEYNGVWISDRYSGQLKMECEHQLCLSHLIRECKYLIETENSTFAKDLKLLFEKAIHYKNNNNVELHTKNSYYHIKEFKNQLIKLFKQPPKEKESRKLWNSLVVRQNQLLLFLDYKDVPPTNNGSERALRNMVTKRKISGGHRSLNGAKRYCSLATVIESAKKQGVDVLKALSPNFSFV